MTLLEVAGTGSRSIVSAQFINLAVTVGSCLAEGMPWLENRVFAGVFEENASFNGALGRWATLPLGKNRLFARPDFPEKPSGVLKSAIPSPITLARQ